MNDFTKKQIDKCNENLLLVIKELESISFDLKSKIEGLDSYKYAEKIDFMCKEYRSVINKLQNFDENRIAEEFISNPELKNLIKE